MAFSGDVLVSGSPTLGIKVGSSSKTATFDSLKASTLLFTYTVAAGDTDTDGIEVVANSLSGTITAATLTPVLTHTAYTLSTAKVDTTAPTIEVTGQTATVKDSETPTVTFTLSEASTDFTLDDVVVSGGTLDNFSGSGTSYTARFTPNANSTTNGVVSVASNKFNDAADNANDDGAAPF